LPQAIKALTSDTARTVGLLDRGVIAPGYNADLNIIDFGRLHLYGPEISRDLPAGGRRLIQRADGYVATIVNGEIVYQDGKDSGRRPGRLLRGPQAVPVAA
jgi:N-acyl-D-aspartate/D-glutamate deacylase